MFSYVGLATAGTYAEKIQNIWLTFLPVRKESEDAVAEITCRVSLIYLAIWSRTSGIGEIAQYLTSGQLTGTDRITQSTIYEFHQ